MKLSKKLLSLLLCAIMVLGSAAAGSEGLTDVLDLLNFKSSAEEIISDEPEMSSQASDMANESEDNFYDGILGLFRRIFFSCISFDTDGGTSISNIHAFRFFGKINKPSDPEKEGYTFAGWEPEIPSRAPFFDKTIKAKWTPNKYTITFLANNGEFSDGSVKKEYVIEFGKEITAPEYVERDTYSFTGWSPRVVSPIIGDATYEAQWYKNTSYVYTNSNEDFVSATSDLVNNSLNDEDFDSNNAIDDEFYFGRLIVKADSYKGIDFEELEADKVIYGDDGLAVLQFSSSELAEKCAEYLNLLSNVEYAEADAFVDTPSDVEVEEIPSVTGKNWGKQYINADKYAYYLEQNNFNEMVTVAVIDSGVDKNHPYLKGRVMASSYNSIADNTDIIDNIGHGTHVAGIIVDCTSNLSNVKIVAIKALDTNGGSILSIVNAINYAADSNVDVINLSLEGKYNTASKYIEKAIANARKKGITVVVAAGNGNKDNNNTPVDTAGVCPAYLDDAIVVGALKDDGNIAYFSNYGKSVDVCAPGWAVYSGTLNNSYAYMFGTSQAAPHISAVAAMYKLSHPNYSPEEIEALIKQYCVDKGATGRDDFCGEGCPDMYNAIPDCTVSFNSNGGSSVSAKTTKNSSTVVLPKPTKSYKITLNANGGSVQTSTYTRNCTFNGWYTTSSLSGESYTANESYMLLKSQTLYAKWTSGTLGSVNSPTRDYYTFSGWYDKASGGTYYSTSKQISSNITLYAHWTLNPEQGWSDSVPSGAKSTQTRTVYRYRTRSVSPINTIKTQYQYGYYACSKCGRRWYGPCNCSALGGSCSGYISGPYLAWFDFSPNTGNWKVRTGDGTVWSIDNGSGDYFYTSNSSTVLYQYMTTRQVSEQTGTSYGAWSSWSSWSETNPGNASNTKEVQSKVQYMYRYK